MQELAFEERSARALSLAVREVASNAVRHARGGRACVRRCEDRPGLEVEVRDDGPGIADVNAAMRDGYSTRGSLGLGLGAARRLTDVFAIASSPRGTEVRLVKWATPP